MLDLSGPVWRMSGNGGSECVEVADNLVAEHGIILVRDSKDRPARS